MVGGKNMKVERFEDLEVWKKARGIVNQIGTSEKVFLCPLFCYFLPLEKEG
jgi:hypothetical protein